MDVNGTFRIAVAGLLLAMVSPLCCAQASRPNYDPMAQQRPSQQKDGFVDFTLKRINPCDTDYGQHLDEGRRMVLHESIESAYFWSNIVSLGLLGCLFIIIIYQHRIQRRRAWSASEMLAQYEYSLSLANAQVGEATKRNFGLMEALTLLRESALRGPALPADVPDHSRAPAPRSRTATTPPLPAPPAKETSVKPADASAVSAAATTQPASQIGLFKPEVELVMKVNSLEQQLGRSRDEAKLLRRQVNEVGQRVQAEEQKNEPSRASRAADRKPIRSLGTMSKEGKKDQPSTTRGPLEKFEPGGELGPIEDRNEYEQRLNSLPPDERELAQENTRFADLCQYFSQQKMDVPPEVLEQVGRLWKLAMSERVRSLKNINRELMEYLNDVGQDPGIRQ